ncbi:MAG: hypothetical protein HYZ40_03345 [Rhodospirillales bacterium]|nr:hypothetical protein [Rhodospirillales bacterium]
MSRLGALAATIGILAATALVMATLGFFSMTAGVALESSSRTNWPSVYQFRLYSAFYYAGHSQLVDSLSCNAAASELIRNPGYAPIVSGDGRRLSPHPVDCVLPTGYPTVVGWCPWVLQFSGACWSIAFRDDVLQLPGFKEGLIEFIGDSCSVNERNAREILQRIDNSKEYLPPTMRSSYCASPRSTVIYFVNDRGDVTSVMNRISWLF